MRYVSGASCTGRRPRPTRTSSKPRSAALGTTACTAHMYRDKSSPGAARTSARTLAASSRESAPHVLGRAFEKVFVADGRTRLVLRMSHWREILAATRVSFPNLRRVSCYAMARNVTEKTDAELRELREAGLTTLYIGPESGDDATLKKIAKGADAEEHVRAAHRARAAGMSLSVIALLGIAGARSDEHARATARLVTEMDPAFLRGAHGRRWSPERRSPRCARGRFEVRSPVPELAARAAGRWSISRAPPTPCSGRTTPRTTCPWPVTCLGTAKRSCAPSTARSRAGSVCVPRPFAASKALESR